MEHLKIIIDDTNLSSQGSFSGQTRLKFELNGDLSKYKSCKMVAVFERNRKEYIMPIKEDCSCEIPESLISSNYFRIRIVREKDKTRSTTNTLLITKEA